MLAFPVRWPVQMPGRMRTNAAHRTLHASCIGTCWNGSSVYAVIPAVNPAATNV